ncbi:MAG: SagB/ThcOx family dehydrogenase [Spirochaetes bacterium]|nr:SagB/ThcOx family dehydrogenase [Spirochaetota bacterium]
MKENAPSISLPPPVFDKDGTVSMALKKRKTVRTFSNRKLPLQVLSNILWAACGINRKKGPFGVPGRTAASASNSREIDLYVALPEGAYFYDPALHRLALVTEEDLRVLAIGPGQAGTGANAPVRFIYVADIDKFSKAGFQEPGLYDPEIRKSYYYVDTGLIAGNVYLSASAHGLGAWFHNCNKTALSKKLNLRPNQHALFGQTLGYQGKG